MKKIVNIIFILIFIIFLFTYKRKIFFYDRIDKKNIEIEQTIQEKLDEENNKQTIENNFEIINSENIVYDEKNLLIKKYDIKAKSGENIKMQVKPLPERNKDLLKINIKLESDKCIQNIEGVKIENLKIDDKKKNTIEFNTIAQYNKSFDFNITEYNNRKLKIDCINMKELKIFNSKLEKPKIKINGVIIEEDDNKYLRSERLNVEAEINDKEKDEIKYIWKGRKEKEDYYGYGKHIISVKAIDKYGAESETEEISFEIKKFDMNEMIMGNTIIPIPKGFYYVGGDINTGIIISDDKEDENKAKKLGEEWSITGDPTQKLAHNAAEKLKGNQFVWIPDDTKEVYKGFYLGRYEAGTGENGEEIKFKNNKTFNRPISDVKTDDYTMKNYVSGKITSKVNHIPYFYMSYNTAIQMNKKMYEGEDIGIISRGFTKLEWEKVYKYLAKDVGSDVYKANIHYTESWGNKCNTEIKSDRGKYAIGGYYYIDVFQDATNHIKKDSRYELLTTGSSNQLQKKHLYNIAGNLMERERDRSVICGSCFLYTAAVTYITEFNDDPILHLGTRTVLEIK